MSNEDPVLSSYKCSSSFLFSVPKQSFGKYTRRESLMHMLYNLSHATCGFVCVCFPQKELSILFNLHSAFEQDSLVSSHPLSPPAKDVQTTLEIDQMFDVITYCKVKSQITLAVNIHQPSWPRWWRVRWKHTWLWLYLYIQYTVCFIFSVIWLLWKLTYKWVWCSLCRGRQCWECWKTWWENRLSRKGLK